jgi:prevent-host-death family protein
MKTVTIRELQARTASLVKEAEHYGQILITNDGRPVAKLLLEKSVSKTPYFVRRKSVSVSLKRRIEAGRFGRAETDSTLAISNDRAERG